MENGREVRSRERLRKWLNKAIDSPDQQEALKLTLHRLPSPADEILIAEFSHSLDESSADLVEAIFDEADRNIEEDGLVGKVKFVLRLVGLTQRMTFVRDGLDGLDVMDDLEDDLCDLPRSPSLDGEALIMLVEHYIDTQRHRDDRREARLDRLFEFVIAFGPELLKRVASGEKRVGSKSEASKKKVAKVKSTNSGRRRAG